MALSTSRTVVTQTGLTTHHHFRVRNLISVGVATFSNFKTGSTNIHSVGVEAAGINVLGGDTPIGAGATIYDDGGVRFVGVVTATSFVGSGANLTGIDATAIQTGTTKIQTSATLISNQISGSGIATVQAGGLDVTGIITATSFSGSGANLTSLPAANLTGTLPAISGANLTSLPAANLTGTLPAISGANLTSLPAQATIANNSDNRVITGGSGVNLNGEANLTFNGTNLGIGVASPSQKLHLKDTAPMAQIESSSYSSFVGTAEANDNIGNGTKAGNLVLRGQTGISISGNGGTATQVKIDADGIKFGTDTAAANALSDYEEGSWTPTLNSGTVSTSHAKYIRIGNMCWINAGFSNASDTTSSTAIMIPQASLPFNKAAFADNIIMGTCPHRYFSYSTKDTLFHWVINGSGIQLQSSNDAFGDKAFSTVLHQHIDASYSAFNISGWYTV